MSIYDIFQRKTLREKEQESEKQYRKWQREKAILELKQEIREEKHDLISRSWATKLPFTKLIAIFLFTNFTILEIFIGWVTIQSFTLAYAIAMTPDFSPLITLATAVLGQTLSYYIYASKAKAENTAGGLTYEMAMLEAQNQINQVNDNQTVG